MEYLFDIFCDIAVLDGIVYMLISKQCTEFLLVL